MGDRGLSGARGRARVRDPAHPRDAQPRRPRLRPRTPRRGDRREDPRVEGQSGSVLLDGRDTREFDAAHPPRSLNVTMVQAAVGTRAAWVVDPETPVVVLAAGEAEASVMIRMVEAVGFRDLRGYVAGGIAGWREADLPIEVTEAIDVPELARRLHAGEVTLLDVREDDEWEGGHVERSVHVPYHELREGPPDEVRVAGRPLAVACTAGNRSSLAVSLLRRDGVHDVVHVADGSIAQLPKHGIELVPGGR